MDGAVCGSCFYSRTLAVAPNTRASSSHLFPLIFKSCFPIFWVLGILSVKHPPFEKRARVVLLLNQESWLKYCLEKKKWNTVWRLDEHRWMHPESYVCAWIWTPRMENIVVATQIRFTGDLLWVAFKMSKRDITSHHKNGSNDPILNLPLMICLLCNRHFLEDLVQASNNPTRQGVCSHLQVRCRSLGEDDKFPRSDNMHDDQHSCPAQILFFVLLCHLSSKKQNGIKTIPKYALRTNVVILESALIFPIHVSSRYSHTFISFLDLTGL